MTTKRTILLVSPYWREQHRWMVSSVKLAELWQRRGYRVEVVCMGAKTETKKESKTLTIHTVKDFFLPDPWNYGIAFGFSGHVRRIAAATKPSIIVVNKVLFWSSLSLIPLRLSGYRVILLTDALVGMTWWPRSIVAKVCAFLYAWTLGWLLLLLAHRVVFFHPQPAFLLSALFIKRKTSVIPTGIDESAYAAGKHDPKHPIVTYIGRIESVKGVADLLGAATAVSHKLPFTLQIVGWYKADHPLARQYHRSPRVHFLGLRHDVAKILAHTDIFVLPSYSEGLSNALMEAMASSCACIATNVGGNRVLLQHRHSGLLFHPGDREALTRHLADLLVEPGRRKKYGDAARRCIEEHFSWTHVGERYDALFSSVTR